MARMGPSTAWGLFGGRDLEMVFLSLDKGKRATAFSPLKYIPSPRARALALL